MKRNVVVVGKMKKDVVTKSGVAITVHKVYCNYADEHTEGYACIDYYVDKDMYDSVNVGDERIAIDHYYNSKVYCDGLL